MTKKVTLIRTVVHRTIDGTVQRVHPPIGKAFDYTDKEIEEITKARANGLRDPKNEEDATREELVDGATPVDAGADASLAKPGELNSDGKTGSVVVKGNARAAKASADSDI